MTEQSSDVFLAAGEQSKPRNTELNFCVLCASAGWFDVAWSGFLGEDPGNNPLAVLGLVG